MLIGGRFDAGGRRDVPRRRLRRVQVIVVDGRGVTAGVRRLPVRLGLAGRRAVVIGGRAVFALGGRPIRVVLILDEHVLIHFSVVLILWALFGVFAVVGLPVPVLCACCTRLRYSNFHTWEKTKLSYWNGGLGLKMETKDV